MAGRKQELTLVPYRQALGILSYSPITSIMLPLILLLLEAPTPSQPSALLYLEGTSRNYPKVQMWQIRI
jgi:hypothetical protein